MILKNHNLQNLHTFQLQASTSYYSSFAHLDELKKTLANEAILHLPKLVLGGGSNLVFLENYHGLVLHNQIMGIEVLNEDLNTVKVRVGAGVQWHQLVLIALENKWHGIENLALIPGTVGAAPVQNIGAYGIEVAQTIDQVHFYHWEHQELISISQQEALFGYRDSLFKKDLKNKGIICYVDFIFQKKSNFNLTYAPLQEKFKGELPSSIQAQEVVQAVIDIRNSKLPNPTITPNAGSFFKNPVISKGHYDSLIEKHPKLPQYAHPEGVKIPAAYLIEQSGWKGRHLNTVGVHHLQALVLINLGNAKAEDLHILIQRIQKDIYQSFKILLEPEVQLIRNV